VIAPGYKHSAPPELNAFDCGQDRSVSSVAKSIGLMLIILGCAVGFTSSQTRRRSRTTPAQTQAPRGSAAKYSGFRHPSEKHKSLECNACHKIPTVWTAKRDFPDVADFPDHDSCVQCHRQQFFTRQAFSGTGPAICTVCHLRAAPREDARFAFGKPNNSNQTLKAKEERQFTIEFPHDKHQNVIALFRPPAGGSEVVFTKTSLRIAAAEALPQEVSQVVGAGLISFTPGFSQVKQNAKSTGNRLNGFPSARQLAVTWLKPGVNKRKQTTFEAKPADEKKPDYYNCSICHATNNSLVDRPPAPGPDSFAPPAGTFKTPPRAHDACFNCHWKNEKPSAADCAGCHKPAATFVPPLFPERISARFSHEGGKGEHVMECTSCHINITRAASLRGLTPDVPVAACTTCHKDSKKTTYPKAVTIEEEFEQSKRTGVCTYCHTTDVGKRKAPASHDAAAQ